jgi:DNA-binding NarL/FixJ family response regulator
VPIGPPSGGLACRIAPTTFYKCYAAQTAESVIFDLPMTKIIVIDDHTLFRVGLIAILKKEPNFEVIGEYRSFNPLKPQIPTLDAQIVMVDISMGKESGLEIVKYIKNVNPSLKVVILSSHKEEFYVVNALEAGVDGYIHKDAEPEELIAGLHKIERGEKFYSNEISSLLINSIYNKPQKGVPFLTSKEKQIIQYLMDGHSSKEIAEILDVSPRTVETHRANVLSKFGLKNTTELINKIAEQKIKF